MSATKKIETNETHSSGAETLRPVDQREYSATTSLAKLLKSLKLTQGVSVDIRDSVTVSVQNVACNTTEFELE